MSQFNELSTHKGCVLWGLRVVIPKEAQPAAMKLLHANHPGVTAMKRCARSHLWWPDLDKEIERCIQICSKCQQQVCAPVAAPSPTWERPQEPWSLLHMDFAGPFEGKMLPIVVDTYSKWLEVHICASATAATVIDALRSMFATFGMPKVVCSDNGTPFLAKDTNQFLQANNIRHITSAPYHPAINGQAERMVWETKESLRKLSQGSLNCR